MKRFVLILAAILSLASCRKEEVEPDFIRDGDIRLMNGQTTLLRYDMTDSQISFDSSVFRFVIVRDNASEFCTMDFSELPRENGQTICGTILWATDTYGIDIKSNVTLEVVKTEGDKFWLWNSNGGIKAVIRVLE